MSFPALEGQACFSWAFPYGFSKWFILVHEYFPEDTFTASGHQRFSTLFLGNGSSLLHLLFSPSLLGTAAESRLPWSLFRVGTTEKRATELAKRNHAIFRSTQSVFIAIFQNCVPDFSNHGVLQSTISEYVASADINDAFFKGLLSHSSAGGNLSVIPVPILLGANFGGSNKLT